MNSLSKNLRLLMPTGLAIVVMVMPALASASPESEITARYKSLSQLSLKKDMPGLKKLWAVVAHKDFVATTGPGVPKRPDMNAKQMESQLEAQFGMIDKVKAVDEKISKITKKGKDYIVTVSTKFVATFKSNDPKKTATITSISQTEDTWVPSPTGYKLKKILFIKEDTKMN